MSKKDEYKLKMISVNIQWFKRLVEIGKVARKQLIQKKVAPMGLDWINHLLGYVESAEDFYKNK